MYGAGDYLAHFGYGAMPLFQNEIIWGQSNFFVPEKIYRSRDRTRAYCHKYGTVPKILHTNSHNRLTEADMDSFI